MPISTFLLYNYVETKTYPKDLNKSGKYVLRRSSKNYVVEEEKLYYVDKTADNKATFRRLVIQGREEVERVFSECHLTAGGHRGRDSTIEKIRSRYYWPNYYKEIEEKVAHSLDPSTTHDSERPILHGDSHTTASNQDHSDINKWRRGRKRPSSLSLSTKGKFVKKTKSSKQANDQSDVIIISEIDDDYEGKGDYEGDEEEDDRDGDTWHTVHGLTLTKYDKNVILHGKWLTDKIIHAAQLLLKMDGGYPVGSLHCKTQFLVKPTNSRLPLMRASRLYILQTTTGLQSAPSIPLSECRTVYAAKYRPQRKTDCCSHSHERRRHYFGIRQHSSELFLLQIICFSDLVFASIETEKCIDCGVFAIANAIAICNGDKPEELTFRTAQMRDHLFRCIQEQQIRPFPSTKRRCQNHTKRTEILPVYCNCRLPEEGQMFFCQRCYGCLHATSDATVTTTSHPLCDNCKD